MFADLSVKTTLFTVLLISLASISIAQEDKPIKFTLSIQKSIHHPEADIEFERTDSNIKWFSYGVLYQRTSTRRCCIRYRHY